MQLVKPVKPEVFKPLKDLNTPQKKLLIRGDSYMAFVKVTPFYEEGNPMPKLLRYNELIPRKPKEDKQVEQQDLTSIRREVEEL